MASGWTLLAGFAGGLTIASLFQSIRDLSQPGIKETSTEAATGPELPRTPAALPDNELKQRLLNSELQAALAQFQAGYLARAAHELRSPLSTLMSLNQLILADLCESPAEERVAVQRSQIAARRLLQLLDQLIVVSQWQSGRLPLRFEDLAIAPVLTRLQTVLQPIAAGRNLALHWPTDWSTLPMVNSDRRALEHCLLHWLQAAIAAPGCTQIQLRIRAEQSDWWVEIDHDGPAWTDVANLEQSLQGQGLSILIGQQLLDLLGGQLEFSTPESGSARLSLRLLGRLVPAIAASRGAPLLVAQQTVAAADQQQEEGAVGHDPNAGYQQTPDE
ncbi:sensor histidine kinase [Synechococcus elongatus]|uniref:histidine kinase n=2 Tax=Synechococcus elongatus TaxID=32046 RepID=Q31KZ7_SYNE7|nr:histidine kinase dimerization/phospho-acceptor domain-containing protein [Synechococcus elongatus]AJD57258.1 histidine kinase [Synechococcus elongatus UTEX 2973]UOW72069.1 histidine kinase [Synechococcus elongatus PCC 7943]UOW74788.1 histidine kinase [Synechococcus elongatus PCC 6311]UOW77509.1 histidine kinase [Synechococcus elongatus PCC 6301]ABB58272.1 histidine kinase [Synechococcus elongatus PCC 7942 = FACHB-805]